MSSAQGAGDLDTGESRHEVMDGGGVRGSRPRVIYWNNIPAPYMIERFNAIAERGNIELEAWFDARTKPGRSWTIDEATWRFPYRYMRRVRVGWRTISLPTTLLAARRPDLLVSLYATPSFLLGLSIAWLRQWRTALWVEVTFDAWVRRRPWKDLVKRAVFRRVDGIITPGQDGRAFALRYGAPSARVHIARHVVDVNYFASKTAAARPARDQLRSELGLAGIVFVYVGRLWWGKGIRTLIAAYRDVERTLPGEASLLIVGDGTDQAQIEQMAKADGLRVKLAGFHQKTDLPRLYAVADVFVFPTLGDPYGLVIDEAMAAGLPIISTTAAGEIGERVVEGVNGHLVAPGDAEGLAAAMRHLVADAGVRREMGLRSAEMIATYTPDRWAEAFERAVVAILSSQPRGRRA